MTATSGLLLSGQYLLTMDEERSLIEDGALLVAGDSILALGTRKELSSRFPQAEELHSPDGLIMPGLINVHTHAAMSLFRGLADDLPLMQWLSEYIFPVEATLTAEMVHTGTLLSLCEMIRSGTTSFCDMYLFAGAVAEAVEESGMRAWLGEAIYDFPSPSYGELENGLALCQELTDRYREHPLIEMTAVAHAVYTCAPSLLVRVADMARRENLCLAIHLAENEEEDKTCRERYGLSPVQHLEQLGVLGPNLIAAHCVMLDEEEIRLLAQRGVKVAHCPQSNMKLGSGIAPIDTMLAAGVSVGLGTDGSASNNTVDMFAEMNCMVKIHKARRRDPLPISAQQALHCATLGGATVLGAEQSIGSLAVGKKADCIVVDLDQPHLTPLYHPVSHLVYAVKGSDVVHSMVNGRLLMQDRKLLTLDENAILEEANTIAAAIAKRQPS